MTRTCCAARIGCFLLAVAMFSGWSTAWAEDKPSITLVVASTDDVFADFKLAFDLVGDKGDAKGFDTLKSTIETFLVGIDTTKPAGARVYSTASGLQPVLTFPVTNDQEFKKLRLNLWDLDIKTCPPPDPKLIRQIPPSVQQKAARAHLTTNEFLIFKLYEGFLKYEKGLANFGQQIETARLVKGAPLPADLVKGIKLAVLIDGQAQPAEKRKQSFEVAKKEMVAAIVKGEHESEPVFAGRKSFTEHQIAELERFFVESEKILFAWNVSHEKKESELNADLVGLPGTELEKSIELLDGTPDEFAGVSKTDAVFSLSVNFPVDPMRQAYLKTAGTVQRAAMKQTVVENEKSTAEEKAIDGDLVDLLFDVVDGTGQLGVANCFIRSWPDANGGLNTVAGGRIPDGTRSKFEKMLSTLAQRSANNKLEEKIATQGEVAIHKLTIPELAKQLPEFVGKEGIVYVGTHDKSVWVAAGANGLALLQKSITEAATAGGKHGPVIDLAIKVGPYVEILNNYYVRNPQLEAPAKKPADGKKKSGGKSSETKKVEVAAFMSAAELRKIALEVFKPGSKDTITLTCIRDGKTVKTRLNLPEATVKFAGTALSKFVKENLED